MTTSRLSALFWPTPTYDHQLETKLDPDDQCLICKEPYVTNADEDGCHAIRLTACSHVIGHECFAQWSHRMPNTCPYWNHHLPSIPQICLPDENFLVTLLRWVCCTRWFLFIDNAVSLAPANAQQILAFTALHQNRVTFTEGATIWYFYFYEAASNTFVIWIVLSLLIIVSTTSVKAFFIGAGLKISVWPVMRCLLRCTRFTLICHAVIFLTIVSCAIALALYRSTRQH